MPKPVKLAKGREFQFKSGKGGGGQPSKYPWDEWFNGELLMLEQSVGTKNDKGEVVEVGTHKGDKRDYEAPTDQMPYKIKAAARKRYKVVQISRYDADGVKLTDAVIIQARDMTPQEREKEDFKRAEEEDVAKARKEKAKAKKDSEAAA